MGIWYNWALSRVEYWRFFGLGLARKWRLADGGKGFSGCIGGNSVAFAGVWVFVVCIFGDEMFVWLSGC